MTLEDPKQEGMEEVPQGWESLKLKGKHTEPKPEV